MANDEICRVKTRKIVITGGPGTGKTSIIQALGQLGYSCFPEISREITKEAQKKGIDQLFLKDPLLFSEMLLEGRIRQYRQAAALEKEVVFIDRGLPDVLAYMYYSGDAYPPVFDQLCEQYRYDQVFMLPPWEKIYTSDNERYETYEQAVAIHQALVATYREKAYVPVEVPVGPVAERTAFILDRLE